MSIQFDSEVIVVTGAANGLGRAYALLLAERGARVVVNDIGGSTDGMGTDGSAAAAVVEEIERAGGTAIAQTSDGSTVEGAKALIDATLEAFGQIDGVIANAGILRDKTFHKMSDEDFWKVVDVHLGGTVRTIHQAYPHMRERGYGRIVTTTSGAGLFSNFGQANYAAAKLGIVGFTRVLALEGAKYDVKANVISPMALTRLSGAAAAQALPEEMQEKGHPRKIAPLAAYLVHPSCEITGETLSAGFGRIARAKMAVTAGLSTDDPTPEWVQDNIEAIVSQEIALIPNIGTEELALIDQAVKVAV